MTSYPNPEKTFTKRFWPMYENQTLTDVSLTVKDKEFKLHKVILAAQSPVFAAMFKHHNVKESRKQNILITDFDKEVVEEFIRYAYTGKCNLTNIDLLIFADKYDVEDLKSSCELALIGGLNSGNAVLMLQLADTHGAPLLKTAALKYVKENTEELMETDEWKSMTPTLLNDVIRFFARWPNSRKRKRVE